MKLATLVLISHVKLSEQLDDSCKSDFATKTLMEKYKEMKDKQWTDTKSIEEFCPYQTDLTNALSVIHTWPDCDHRKDDLSKPCLDRKHMFKWMVWRITNATQIYTCIENTLNMFNPYYESDATAIDTSSNFTELDEKCKNSNGMVIPRASNNTFFSQKMKKWGDKTLNDSMELPKLFGITMIQYCYYTPGLSEMEVCKEKCKKLQNQNYFVTHVGDKMYCPNLQLSSKTINDITSNPNVNAWKNFLEKYHKTGIKFEHAVMESSATKMTISFVLCLLFIFTLSLF